jgi:hypothetical protein
MSKRRRNRYDDTSTAGRSDRVPFRHGEGARRRHARRLNTNLQSQEEMGEWCKLFDIALTITNEGHHWQLKLGDKIAEWWPSSAKLVFDKTWAEGVHVHDVDQLKEQLMEKWELES